jgi:NAD+ diphosphatase
MATDPPALAPRPPNKYAASGLDRLHLRRGDSAWFARALADAATRFLPVWQARNLVDDPGTPGLCWIDNGRAAQLLATGAEPTILGEQEGRLYVALDCSFLETPDHAPALAGCGHFVDLRSVGPLLPGPTAALLATARAYAQWHGRHRFCGLCGWATRVAEAGHQRRCSNEACGAAHFPRTDPAVIMLVHDGGDRIILGRQKIWPPGMHSVLAGFVEPGESLEEAVAREVKEEVGIDVAAVTYQSSQPWPFPSSIMLGFWAEAVDDRLRVDPHELESARWVSRAEMLASPEDESFRLPRRDSIARRLIEDWLAATA